MEIVTKNERFSVADEERNHPSKNPNLFNGEALDGKNIDRKKKGTKKVYLECYVCYVNYIKFTFRGPSINNVTSFPNFLTPPYPCQHFYYYRVSHGKLVF